MTLREAAIGQTVRVKKLTGDGPVKRRIMDMGITKGVEINIRKVALTLYTLSLPFGCKSTKKYWF